MITKEEFKKIAFSKGLNQTTIEKDYVIGWILLGISEHPKISKNWIFKGGTCLKKCYFKDYRFSEDCDFTITKVENVNVIKIYLEEISKWVTQKSGILIDFERSIFEELKNTAGQHIIQGRIFYNTPISPQSPKQWPRIKFDLTADEIVIHTPEKRIIDHPYSDRVFFINKTISCYNSYDIFSEKIRALFERTRPRDLFDVVSMEKLFKDCDISILKQSFQKKCLYKNILETKVSSLSWQSCESGWNDQLFHQMKNTVDFNVYKTQAITFLTKLIDDD